MKKAFSLTATIILSFSFLLFFIFPKIVQAATPNGLTIINPNHSEFMTGLMSLCALTLLALITKYSRSYRKRQIQ
jgi:hypothetical protein